MAGRTPGGIPDTILFLIERVVNAASPGCQLRCLHALAAFLGDRLPFHDAAAVMGPGVIRKFFYLNLDTPGAANVIAQIVHVLYVSAGSFSFGEGELDEIGEAVATAVTKAEAGEHNMLRLLNDLLISGADGAIVSRSALLLNTAPLCFRNGATRLETARLARLLAHCPAQLTTLYDAKFIFHAPRYLQLDAIPTATEVARLITTVFHARHDDALLESAFAAESFRYAVSRLRIVASTSFFPGAATPDELELVARLLELLCVIGKSRGAHWDLHSVSLLSNIVCDDCEHTRDAAMDVLAIIPSPERHIFPGGVLASLVLSRLHLRATPEELPRFAALFLRLFDSRDVLPFEPADVLRKLVKLTVRDPAVTALRELLYRQIPRHQLQEFWEGSAFDVLGKQEEEEAEEEGMETHVKRRGAQSAGEEERPKWSRWE